MKYRIFEDYSGRFVVYFPQYYKWFRWHNIVNGTQDKKVAENKILQHKRNQKYRILQKGELFYPQVKKFGFWMATEYCEPLPVAISTTDLHSAKKLLLDRIYIDKDKKNLPKRKVFYCD